MARAFKSTPKGFVADLERAERRLLRTLFQDVLTLLDGGPTPGRAPGPASRPAPGLAAGPVTGTERRGAANGEANDAGRDADAFWDIVASLGPVPGPTAATRRPAPADPALGRLLPAGVAGDDEAARAAAGEFRALTEDAVRRSKAEDLERAVAALQTNPVTLGEPEAVSFGRALNDVRLVLSARLGIESEEDAERVHAVDDWSAATDVESYMALLYNFTTWLLESLMLALSTRLPD